MFPVETRIDTTQIVPASKLVSQITGYPVQPNKAVVGANAFAHESGIHQDGVLKHRETYEIMRAQDVGWAQNKLVLGKHSGRNAFKSRLQELGIELDSDEALNSAFARFKELADRKHEIFDEDLHALVSDEVVTPEQEHYKLVYSHVCSETGEMPHAKVILNVGGAELKGEAGGGGPVDATFKAIENVVGSGAELLLYSVNAITTGTDAQGEVTTRLCKGRAHCQWQWRGYRHRHRLGAFLPECPEQAVLDAGQGAGAGRRLSGRRASACWRGLFFLWAAGGANVENDRNEEYGGEQRLADRQFLRQAAVAGRPDQALEQVKLHEQGNPLVRIALAAQDSEQWREQQDRLEDQP